MPSNRVANLRAALGVLQVAPHATNCGGSIGGSTHGLRARAWGLQLTGYGEGYWRATFYVTGMAHSIVGGSAWEPTPWRAVQRPEPSP